MTKKDCPKSYSITEIDIVSIMYQIKDFNVRIIMIFILIRLRKIIEK